MSSATDPDPPPADGGPLLFFASFFVVPALLIFAILVFPKGGANRFDFAVEGVKVLGFIIPGAVWAYFSGSRWAVALKAGAYGLAVTTAWLVYLKMTTTNPQGDDVMPLFWIFAAPFIAVGGGFLTTCCGLASLGTFWLRQRPRAAWMERVRQGQHSGYRILQLPPATKRRRRSSAIAAAISRSLAGTAWMPEGRRKSR